MASVIRGSDNFDSLVHQGLGVNQTWQDVTGSRAFGATYTNTTGKPIAVMLRAVSTSTGTFGYSVYIDGNSIIGNVADTTATTSFVTSVFFIVPGGVTYLVNKSGGATQTNTWSELR